MRTGVHPHGLKSSVAGRGALPVVQIAYPDALAYAKWLGRDLPTEAEWEYAARGGLKDAQYTWGDSRSTPGSPRPTSGRARSVGGHGRRRLQGAHRAGRLLSANGYGLYDMAGNVWEWTRDWYRPNLDPAQTADPAGPSEQEAFDPGDPVERRHVIKGGSFLCADNFCFRYRPPARQAGPTDTGSDHVGFRTVLRLKGDPKCRALTL